MRITKTLLVAAAVFALSVGVAQAQLVVPLSGIQTFDAFGDPDNTVQNNDVTPDLFINALAWTAVDGATIGASWGSEATIAISNTTQTNVVNLAPFTAQGAPCSPCGPVTGSADTVSNPSLFPMSVPDGNIRLEYFESYVDVSGSPSFNFTAGDLTFTTVVPVELMTFTID